MHDQESTSLTRRDDVSPEETPPAHPLSRLQALSIAGERLISQRGRRWALVALGATLTISPLLALALQANARIEQPLTKLLVSGLIGAAGIVFTLSCLCSWPMLILRASALLRADEAHALVRTPRSFSLWRALKRSFGPTLAFITPLVAISSLGIVWLIAAFDGFAPLMLLFFVLIFSFLFTLGLMCFGGLGVAISGKQALDHRRLIRERRKLQGPETIGALELASDQARESGALSLTQDAGQLTQTSTP